MGGSALDALALPGWFGLYGREPRGVLGRQRLLWRGERQNDMGRMGKPRKNHGKSMVSCLNNQKNKVLLLIFQNALGWAIGMVLCGELGRLQLGIGLVDLVAHKYGGKQKKREKTICFCRVATHPFVWPGFSSQLMCLKVPKKWSIFINWMLLIQGWQYQLRRIHKICTCHYHNQWCVSYCIFANKLVIGHFNQSYLKKMGAQKTCIF